MIAKVPGFRAERFMIEDGEGVVITKNGVEFVIDANGDLIPYEGSVYEQRHKANKRTIAKAKPTVLGKALRERNARLRTGWEHNYAGAIADARAVSNPYEKGTPEWDAWQHNKVARLVDCLRARKPLRDDDFDLLADYVEATRKRGRGAERDEAVHEAARLAEVIMTLVRAENGRVSELGRSGAIKAACKQVERDRGEPVDAERVRDLLSRPKSRRRHSH